VEAGMTCTQVGRLMVPPVSKQAIAKQLKIKNPGPLRAARSGAPPKS